MAKRSTTNGRQIAPTTAKRTAEQIVKDYLDAEDTEFFTGRCDCDSDLCEDASHGYDACQRSATSVVTVDGMETLLCAICAEWHRPYGPDVPTEVREAWAEVRREKIDRVVAIRCAA